MFPQVNFKYPEFQKFVFRWIPGYLRLYRWKLFAEYDRNILSRGTGTWSTELRDTMSKVRPGALPCEETRTGLMDGIVEHRQVHERTPTGAVPRDSDTEIS